ncbi:MAG TPA: HYR domain-containing protein [Planctomycetota bacterium]|nr:HYR domain-containing protein [Planctomycetota bacterium]
MDVSVHDPQSEAIQKLLEANRVEYIEESSPPRVETSGNIGDAVVSLIAINESLQFSKATAAIKVLDPDAPPDTTPPTIALPPGAGAEATGPQGAVVTFAVNVSDNVTLNPAVTFSHVSGSLFPLGTTPVEITATDEAGNVARATLYVSVSDSTPPVVTPSANVTAEAASADGATVAYAPATATDRVTAAPFIAYSHASGSVFPLGVTPVEVLAFDEAGNVGSAVFYVTVVDTTPPAVVSPQDITVEAAGPDGTVVDFPAATASDAVTAAPVINYSHASGSLFPIGVTRVTIAAADAAGNVGLGGFSITVADRKPPEVKLQAVNPATLWPPDHTFATVTLTGSVKDGCSAITAADLSAAIEVIDPARGDGGEKKEPEHRNFKVDAVAADGSFTATIELRRERSGTAEARIYRVKLSARDACGNVGTSNGTDVSVRHDQGK